MKVYSVNLVAWSLSTFQCFYHFTEFIYCISKRHSSDLCTIFIITVIKMTSLCLSDMKLDTFDHIKSEAGRKQAQFCGCGVF